MGYGNTKRGVLFKNGRKESDKHPDYKGSINFGGVDYDLAAWINKSKAGQAYMSLKVGGPIAARGESSDQPAKRQPESDLDDEIPF